MEYGCEDTLIERVVVESQKYIELRIVRLPKCGKQQLLFMENLREVRVILVIHRPNCQFIQQIFAGFPRMCQAAG